MNNPILHIQRAFILVFCCILMFSCKQNADTSSEQGYSNSANNKTTYLKIISKYDGSYGSSNKNHGYIYRVGLVGYSFEDLRIEYDESKIFELDGIPGGLDKVNVSISFKPDENHYDPNSPTSIKCNFFVGKTTTITITSNGSLQVSYN